MAHTLYIQSGNGARTEVTSRYDTGFSRPFFSITAFGSAQAEESRRKGDDSVAEIELDAGQALSVAFDLIEAVMRNHRNAVVDFHLETKTQTTIDRLGISLIRFGEKANANMQSRTAGTLDFSESERRGIRA